MRTRRYLQHLESEKTGKIYIGAPIWQTSEWRHIFYPSSLPSSRYLNFYSEIFDCVELNASFYKTPSLLQVDRWRRQTRQGFQFCPKLSRSISHSRQPSQQSRELKEFLTVMEGLQERLGPIFIQCPEHLSPQYWSELLAFCRLLPKSVRWALELRHPGWFRDHMLADELINALYREQIATVITDTPGRRDALHFSLTQPWVIVRFLGQFPQGPDYRRQKLWMQKLTDWQAQGMQALYFFVHQPQTISIVDSTKTAQRALLEVQYQAEERAQG